MLSPDERAAIRARAEAATEGPWKMWAVSTSRSCVLWIKSFSGWIVFGAKPTRGSYDQRKADAAFIAAARRDIPALLDDLAEQDAELVRLRKIETAAKHWLAEEPDPTGWILLTAKHLEEMRRAVEEAKE